MSRWGALVLGTLLAGNCLAFPAKAVADTPSPLPSLVPHTLPPPPPFHLSTVAPYTDPNAVAPLGFCDKAGQPLLHGSIDDRPFVPIAVSALPTPAEYAVPGVTAQLRGYQPLPGAPPTAWQGELMTAPTRFTDPAHPMAAGTALDFSLRDFMGDFSAADNGFLQFRLYLVIPRGPSVQLQYAAADIQVTPQNTWNLVGAGNVPCNTGTGVSTEDLPPPAAPTATATPVSTPVGTPVAAANSKGDSREPGVLAKLVLPVLLAAVLALLLLRGRRRPGQHSDA
ncbi:MAG: hypothetical protein NVSMB32_12540 [Actinomycetota bacterium]